MFRRKDEGVETMETVTETTEAAIDTTPAAPVAAPAATVPAAPTFRPVPPQAAMAARASVAQPVTMERPQAPSARALGANKRVLSVGPDIQMKGEISTCDRLVIEGVVDATIRDVHTVELTETGALKGTAEVEDAEISGAFEGDLLVRGKLTVHSTGRVRGNVTYGEIEIQRGGQVSGNVRNSADAKSQPANQNYNKPKAA